MEIIKQSNRYLNILYFKSQRNLGKGYSHLVISKMMGIERNESNDILKYLSGKNYVDTTNGYGDDVVLSSLGIDYLFELRKNKHFRTLRFKKSRYLDSGYDGIEFLFF